MQPGNPGYKESAAWACHPWRNPRLGQGQHVPVPQVGSAEIPTGPRTQRGLADRPPPPSCETSAAHTKGRRHGKPHPPRKPTSSNASSRPAFESDLLPQEWKPRHGHFLGPCVVPRPCVPQPTSGSHATFSGKNARTCYKLKSRVAYPCQAAPSHKALDSPADPQRLWDRMRLTRTAHQPRRKNQHQQQRVTRT